MTYEYIYKIYLTVPLQNNHRKSTKDFLIYKSEDYLDFSRKTDMIREKLVKMGFKFSNFRKTWSSESDAVRWKGWSYGKNICWFRLVTQVKRYGCW